MLNPNAMSAARKPDIGQLPLSGITLRSRESYSEVRIRSGIRDSRSGLHGMLFEFDQRSVFDADAQRMDVIGALVLRLVHQLVGAIEQFLCKLVRDGATLGDVAQHEADDADVDPHRLGDQPRIVAGPVMAFDRFAEAFGDHPRGAALVEIRNEEAEFVAPEPRVQVLTGADVNRLLRNEVVRADLFAKQPRHAIDNLVAGRVAKRIVVPLERIDIDQADGAPAATLFEREKRLDLLDEAAEVHEPRLGIAVHAVGEVRDEVLEISRDAADRRVAGGKLVAQPLETVRKAGGHRLDGLLLGLLPELLVLHEHVVDRVDQRLLVCGRQVHALADPLMELGSGLRRGIGVDVEAFAHSHGCRPAAGRGDRFKACAELPVFGCRARLGARQVWVRLSCWGYRATLALKGDSWSIRRSSARATMPNGGRTGWGRPPCFIPSAC